MYWNASHYNQFAPTTISSCQFYPKKKSIPVSSETTALSSVDPVYHAPGSIWLTSGRPNWLGKYSTVVRSLYTFFGIKVRSVENGLGSDENERVGSRPSVPLAHLGTGSSAAAESSHEGSPPSPLVLDHTGYPYLLPPRSSRARACIPVAAYKYHNARPASANHCSRSRAVTRG
jgi:hypothetical protein